MDLELIIAIIFYSVLGVIIYLNRKKFTVMGKVILAYKTKKPIKWMDKLAKHKTLWKIYGTICIPITFYFMFILIYALIDNAINIGLNPGSTPGVTPLIPGIRIPGSPLYVPLFYGIASILILAIVHEFAHGILARTEGLRIKNTGFGMFFIFPLFFVEPDREDMNKAGQLKRLRIASVGAGTNIILSFCIFALLAQLFIPFFDEHMMYTGVEISSLRPGYPAENATLSIGDVIIGVNGVQTLNITAFSNELTKAKVGNEAVLRLKGGEEISLILAPNPANNSLPYIGVYLKQEKDYTSETKMVYSEQLLAIITIIFELLLWIANINFLVGIMNLLPVWGLDGGLMVHDMLAYIMKGKYLNKVLTIIYGFSLTVLLWNLIGPYIII